MMGRAVRAGFRNNAESKGTEIRRMADRFVKAMRFVKASSRGIIVAVILLRNANALVPIVRKNSGRIGSRQTRTGRGPAARIVSVQCRTRGVNARLPAAGGLP
jgi:hypothetical protein